MAYKTEPNVNVVEAAGRRVLEAFNKNKYIALSFSGGKDSICLADVVVTTMQKYGIAFNRLLVAFVDEEAIYPDIEKTALEWRSKFLSLGAKFYWLCIPVKHFNCCSRLANDETFICWEPGKESVWVRPLPKFAIRNHAKFRMGMNYQTLLPLIFGDIPTMVGLRMSESIQRLIAVSVRGSGMDGCFYPIYDWKDRDVWLYIQTRGLQLPMSYIYLYKCGVPLNKLRISQFFSIDTIKTLPKVMEFYPDLYERVIRREPNADLAMLYYDTEMFRSSKQDGRFGIEKDFKAALKEEMKKAASHPGDYPGYKTAKLLFSKVTEATSQKTYRLIYQILIAGDPKDRIKRAACGALTEDEKRRIENGTKK